jgi:hypothetical protein
MAEQTSTNFNSSLQQNIFNQQLRRANTIQIASRMLSGRKALARCTQALNHYA